MPIIESSRTEDALLSKSALENWDNECVDLYPLTDRQVTLIYSLLRYADWDARWVDRQRDNELVETTKDTLMGRCLDDLIKSNLLLMGAITGRPINLSSDGAVSALLTTDADFSEDGLVPTIRTLTGASEDYSDELTLIAGYVLDTALILGAVA
jgi:hypothetical protein